ncbi:Uncharacterised protein [Mycobacteroides abscessus]|nr:Uncharacterised protein [Mycobacteroides abscessus]SIJ08595.1 Uncharacterised protein [Mycobacteroides abscessus subsp. abscessus]
MGHDCRRISEEVLRQRHHIYAEVEKGTAAECGIEQSILAVERPVDAEVCLHLANLADGAVVDKVFRGDDRGLEPCPHCLHRENATGPCDVDNLLCAGNGRGEGLLDQDGLAGGECGDSGLAMLGMRSCDVHRVDVWVGEELPI